MPKIQRISPILLAFLIAVTLGSDARADLTQAQGAKGSATADESTRRAEAAVREWREAEALEILRASAKEHPEWPPPRLILARIYLVIGQVPAGRKALERAAAESPDDPRVFLELAGLALADGRLAEARLDAEAAQGRLKSPKLNAEAARIASGEVASTLAAVAEALSDWPLASTRLRELLAIEPTRAAPRQRLARAMVAQGDTAGALKELTRAAQDDPSIGPPGLLMARLVAGTGDSSKAEEWFAYASKAEPKSAAVRIAQARWRVEQGRAAEARAFLDEASKLDPSSKEIDPLRGLAAWYARDLATAERIYEGRHRDAPLDEEAANTLALILIEQADEAKRSRGFQLAEANARQFPRSADVLATYGWSQERQGKRDSAEEVLKSVIQKSGGQASPTTAFFLASVLAAKGQTAEARSLASAALAAPGVFPFRAEARKLMASLDEPTRKPAADPRRRVERRDKGDSTGFSALIERIEAPRRNPRRKTASRLRRGRIEEVGRMRRCAGGLPENPGSA